MTAIRGLERFARIVLAKFAIGADPGEPAEPGCLYTKELSSDEVALFWGDDLRSMGSPPFAVDSDTLFISFDASRELGCFLALGWSMPTCVLDLAAEFRCQTNGLKLPVGDPLPGALAYFGIHGVDCGEKEFTRKLAQRGGPWSEHERAHLAAYCENGVIALEHLLHAMAPRVDLPLALLRGGYARACAAMERVGIPINVDLYQRIRDRWKEVRLAMVKAVDCDFGVYDGERFCEPKWREWAAEKSIDWPRHESGRLALNEATFERMAARYPVVRPILKLRKTLAELRPPDLQIGSDGRSRCALSPFRSKTGRNQPSSTRFVFGLPAWMRGIIRPSLGNSLAYLDWSQQEFGIAAALSRDDRMLEAYLSGDPYLTFARQAGLVPAGATRASHAAVRERSKRCVLGVLYGMGERTLAGHMECTLLEARRWLDAHRRTYAKFWAWSDAVVDHAKARCSLHTVFGWMLRVGPDVSPTTLRNFPMQANAAEMLRLACVFALDRGIKLCATVHDAVLIEAAENEIVDAAREMRACMTAASRDVLGGLELRVDSKIVRFPQTLLDSRGADTWRLIIETLGLVEMAPLKCREEDD